MAHTENLYKTEKYLGTDAQNKELDSTPRQIRNFIEQASAPIGPVQAVQELFGFTGKRQRMVRMAHTENLYKTEKKPVLLAGYSAERRRASSAGFAFLRGSFAKGANGD
ncbi:hypothetical protein CYMTET_30225 [Cymbomonas tetramitiformis]|uniref:Uncharacterized protein n=1 Tax=Cymbomonas tetramitiformis TaxID=36881 RepID=A0AAE0FKU7_9CHLO|nr:hypothetical protein CYMTET_30225 [Cymbomonas tetramitiformis]